MITIFSTESKLTCWKVLRDANIEPPIQTLYFLSGGATTLIFMLLGARAEISLLILSIIPGNMVEPPLRTMLPYKSFLISTSHFTLKIVEIRFIFPQLSQKNSLDIWLQTSCLNDHFTNLRNASKITNHAYKQHTRKTKSINEERYARYTLDFGHPPNQL